MSHSLRSNWSVAMQMASGNSTLGCAGSHLKLVLPLLACFCTLSVYGQALSELPSPLIAYASVSLLIPDPTSVRSFSTTVSSEPASSLSQESSSAAECEVEVPAWLNGLNPNFEAALDHYSYLGTPQFDSALKLPAHEGRFGDEEFVLLRTRMPSRYAYDSWANLKTGYGRYFPDETVARSCTSGAGIEDPDWVYIKMTFRF